MGWIRHAQKAIRRLRHLPPRCFLDPEAWRESVKGVYNELLRRGAIVPSTFEDAEFAFIQDDYTRWSDRRDAAGAAVILNQLPHVTNHLATKDRLAEFLNGRPYVPETHLEAVPGSLEGLWVEKPFDGSRGQGIRFLRDPEAWSNPRHVLQRYVENPYLLDGRKFGTRVLARIDDEGVSRIHSEVMLQCASEPYSVESLDPLVHNANFCFQNDEGVAESCRVAMLSDLPVRRVALERIHESVEDVTKQLNGRGLFRGSDDFELLGIDFVIHDDGEVSLLEINRTPGFRFRHPQMRRFFRQAVKSLFL